MEIILYDLFSLDINKDSVDIACCECVLYSSFMKYN
jgi:hypothetical protein